MCGHFDVVHDQRNPTSKNIHSANWEKRKSVRCKWIAASKQSPIFWEFGRVVASVEQVVLLVCDGGGRVKTSGERCRPVYWWFVPCQGIWRQWPAAECYTKALLYFDMKPDPLNYLVAYHFQLCFQCVRLILIHHWHTLNPFWKCGTPSVMMLNPRRSNWI